MDNKVGLVAFLRRQSPFNETQMTYVSGQTFTQTVTGLTLGTTITYAVKFAFAGGLSVTKYISYVVGNNCSLGIEGSTQLEQQVYPNPVENLLHLQLSDEQNYITLTDVLGKTHIKEMVNSNGTIDMSSLKPGIYFLRVENAYGIKNIKIVKK